MPLGHRREGQVILSHTRVRYRNLAGAIVKREIDLRSRSGRRSPEGRRPGAGRQEKLRLFARLRALLAIPLQNLALGGKPVFSFVAARKTAALGEFVSAAPNFVFQVDGHDVRP